MLHLLSVYNNYLRKLGEKSTLQEGVQDLHKTAELRSQSLKLGQHIKMFTHTTSALAKTIGKAKELTMKPIVIKTASSMHGELEPPLTSDCLRAIIVGMGLST